MLAIIKADLVRIEACELGDINLDQRVNSSSYYEISDEMFNQVANFHRV